VFSDDPVKQEVWETLRELNDAWVRGRPEELKAYLHEDMVAITATDRDRLEGREACAEAWSVYAKKARIHHWKELEPRIQIYGGTAVATYYFDISFLYNGQTVAFSGREMLVFVKVGGKWLAVAGQR